MDVVPQHFVRNLGLGQTKNQVSQDEKNRARQVLPLLQQLRYSAEKHTEPWISGEHPSQTNGKQSVRGRLVQLSGGEGGQPSQGLAFLYRLLPTVLVPFICKCKAPMIKNTPSYA